MKYINTTRDKTTSDFVRTEPTFDGSVVQFGATSVNPSINGTVVPMVKGFVRLSVPSAVASCNPEACAGTINEAVKVEFNIKGGDTASLAGLRSEVNRVLDIALADHNFANGIVPPVSTTFASA